MSKHVGLPVVAVTLGDPAGIGPELTAKLLSGSVSGSEANIVLVGDPWLWAEGQGVARVTAVTQPISSLAEARERPSVEFPAFLGIHTVRPEQVHSGQAEAPGGASVLKVLDCCLTAALDREIDALCFAPLNKFAMKQAGLQHEDELHFFAERLGVSQFFCEFNTLRGLWTSRISSHIPLKDVANYIGVERIVDATKLIYQTLQSNGVARPRVAVAGLNPHNGDGGTCGREEIDIIAPAVAVLNEQGFAVSGPFPADTIFLKARDGELDAIVTMYHDQGQIALKLLGFSEGVTVQGGLPIPITTPAHGTAYDIAGLGKANVDAMVNAFQMACRLGRSHRLHQADG